MRVLVFGESAVGGLCRSLVPGLVQRAEVVVADPTDVDRSVIDRRGPSALVRRQAAQLASPSRLIGAIRATEPDVVLIVKGRGLSARTIVEARRLAPIAVYYPDNPFWLGLDRPDPIRRLAAADLTIMWSQRLADALEMRGARTVVVPFGYDDRWFPLVDAHSRREGIVFLGTWSRRRERYLSALQGLPLVVHGTAWPRNSAVVASPAIYEEAAGALLAGAAIGINLLHPQCAGAHNMRTREIASSGALQIADFGTDGTPLRHRQSCLSFHHPEELRSLAEWHLDHPDEGVALAATAQGLIAPDSYTSRADAIIAALATLATER